MAHLCVDMLLAWSSELQLNNPKRLTITSGHALVTVASKPSSHVTALDFLAGFAYCLC